MNLANRITLLRIALVPVYMAIVLARFPGSRMIALVVFVIASLTDMLDGRIARSRDMVTDFGKFMDPIADKLLVTAALLVLLWEGWLGPVEVLIFIGREFIVSGLRMVASGKGIVIAASWLGKAKTVAQMIMIIILMLENWPFSLIGLPMDSISIWAAAILTLWSMIDYVYKNRKVMQ